MGRRRPQSEGQLLQPIAQKLDAMMLVLAEILDLVRQRIPALTKEEREARKKAYDAARAKRYRANRHGGERDETASRMNRDGSSRSDRDANSSTEEPRHGPPRDGLRDGSPSLSLSLASPKIEKSKNKRERRTRHAESVTEHAGLNELKAAFEAAHEAVIGRGFAFTADESRALVGVLAAVPLAEAVQLPVVFLRRTQRIARERGPDHFEAQATCKVFLRCLNQVRRELPAIGPAESRAEAERRREAAAAFLRQHPNATDEQVAAAMNGAPHGRA